MNFIFPLILIHFGKSRNDDQLPLASSNVSNWVIPYLTAWPYYQPAIDLGPLISLSHNCQEIQHV